MSPNIPIAPDRRGRKTLIALLGVIVIAKVVLLGYLVWSGYREAMLSAETTSRNYAAIIEARLDATLRRADSVLQERVRTIPVAALNPHAVPRYAREINATLDSHLINFRELAGLRISDSDGNLLYSTSRNTTARPNFADRDWFRQVRDGPPDSLVFSEALIGRTLGRTTVIAARALRDGQGVFRGVVSAPINLEYFQKLFQSLDLGPHGTISLRRADDQRLVLRWPELADAVNTPLVDTRNPTVQGLLPGGRTRTQHIRAETDGITRIYSTHTLERYPFRVAVAVALDDVLAHWRARTLAVGVLALLLLILLVSLLYRLVRAEARLTANEELMRITFEQAAVGIAHIAPGTYRILMMNDRFAELLGYTQDELIGTDSRRLTPRDDMPAREAERAKVLSGAINISVSERQLLRKDGSLLWVSRSLSLVRDAAGQPQYFISVIEDITARKHAEESLQRHSLVLHSMAESVNYTDAQGTIRFTNSAFDRIFGYEPGELIGQPVSRLNALPAEENARLVAEILGIIHSGKRWEGEFRNRRKDGTIFHTYARITGLQHAGEIWSVTVQEDITARKKAEAELLRLNAELETRVEERTRALQESEERFSKLAEAIDEVFWLSDVGIKKMVYISPAYERVWGRSLQSLYDDPKSFIDSMHPEDRDRALADLDVQKTGQPFDHEYRIIRPDGSIRWIWDRGFPIQPKAGPVGLYAGVATDITERKRAEELQRVSEERARELLRRLIEAQEGERRRIAADLHDVVGQNLSALEIELQRLRGAAQSGNAGAMLDNMASIIQDSTNSVRDAISDLHPAVLDDYGVLVAVEAYVSRIERLTGLRITVRGNAPQTRLARKTELALFRVIQEALMNTVKHAVASQVTVDLSQAGDVLQLRVEDDGKGIADVPPGQKRAGGWGIEFMRERAVALGGTLRIESPGAGTRVIMEIPLGNSNHPD